MYLPYTVMCIILKGERKMTRCKTFAAIGVILMFAAATFMMFTPTVQALDLPTYIIVTANPNPVGVGQPLYVNAFMTKPNQGASMGTAGSRYEGMSIVITKPGGATETFGPRQADATGGIFTTFYATQVGEYSIQAFYPGQVISSAYTYLASQSDVITITVQEEAIPMPVSPPLPTDYWSRPIMSINFEWGAKLGSNWWGLGGPSFTDTGGYSAEGNVQPYGKAPYSSHILWTKPTAPGGQAGGEIISDQEGQFTSTSILKRHFEPIIVYGILCYQDYPTANNPSGIGNPVGWKAVDLRTGELLWERTRGITGSETLVWGQVQKFHTIQEYGSWAALWSAGSGGMMYVYDLFTGAHMANVTDAPAPAMLSTRTGIVNTWDYLALGGIFRWYTSGSNLIKWNSTRLFSNGPSGQRNWTTGIEWSFNMTTKYPVGTPTSIALLSIDDPATGDGVILMRSAPNLVTQTATGYQVTAGIDIRTGDLLWGPLNQTIPQYQDISLIDGDDGVYVLHNKDTNEAYGYSLDNGNLLWGPVKLQGNAFSYLMRGAEIAYGQVYIWDFGGFVSALDLKTGNINWVFSRGSAGYTTPYGIWPIWAFGSHSIADGILFLSESHMYDPPMSPGMQRLAIDCTTGELVWSILSFCGRSPGAIADGMLAQWNSYDKQIYAFGQGQTSTTVSVSNKFSVHGQRVLVEGMVMDESPGTKNADRIARFPNGVPAVSDDSMSDWMLYVYKQFPVPTNAAGVEVIVEVLDPNNNYYEVGRTTSDATGFFKLAFTPEVPGEYTIVARFAGSKAYFGSYAETGINVDEAPDATPEPTQAPTSLADQYLLPGIGGIIAAIAVVGALILLMLRKK